MAPSVVIPKGHTNATRQVMVGRDKVTREPIMEEQQINETIPGGYYISSDGTPRNANGDPLDGSAATPTLAELFSQMSPDNPMYARMKAAAEADVTARAQAHVPRAAQTEVVNLPTRPGMATADDDQGELASDTTTRRKR